MELTCEYCGWTGPDVQEVVDPFMADLFGEIVDMVACDRCCQDRADDV